VLIDTHCHLDAPEFAEDRDAVAREAAAAGVAAIIVPAVLPSNFAAVRACCERHAACRPAYGTHLLTSSGLEWFFPLGKNGIMPSSLFPPFRSGETEMTLSKEVLRKIHKIPEPTGPIDPAVQARRKYHEAAARWLAKWHATLQAINALIGFVVILLPMFSKPWRAVIESIPIVASVFHDFSTFSGSSLILLSILIVLLFVRSSQLKNIPGWEEPTLTYRNVVEMELYPRTKKQEFAYWTDIFSGFAGTTFWLFLPFGSFAYFMRIGGA
jgi:hypothetical protein